MNQRATAGTTVGRKLFVEAMLQRSNVSPASSGQDVALVLEFARTLG